MENGADGPVKMQVVHFDIREVVLTRIGPPSLLEAETVAPNHCNVLLSTWLKPLTTFGFLTWLCPVTKKKDFFLIDNLMKYNQYLK